MVEWERSLKKFKESLIELIASLWVLKQWLRDPQIVVPDEMRAAPKRFPYPNLR